MPRPVDPWEDICYAVVIVRLRRIVAIILRYNVRAWGVAAQAAWASTGLMRVPASPVRLCLRLPALM